MSLRIRLRRPASLLTVPSIAILLMIALAPAALAQEDAQRCEGKVTDPDGNPLRGVEITFLDLTKNKYAQSVKTNKKGKYAHNTLGANTSKGWEIRAHLDGYKIVQITALSVSSDGNRITDETYMVGFNQEGLHAVRVPPQARFQATSKGRCVVDFVMVPEDQYQEAYRHLRVAMLEAQGKTAEEIAQMDATGAGPAGEGEAAAPPRRDPLEAALAAIRAGDWAGAVEPAREAAADDPDNAEAHYRLGQALLKTGDLAGAEPELKKARELDPTLTGLNFELGILYVEKGRLMQAVPYFEQENELFPDNPTIMHNLGNLYMDTEQYDKAVGLFEELVALEPDNIEYYGSLAEAYKALGDTEMERETYERMGEQDPTGMAFYNLGTLMFNRDEMASAAAAYEKAIEQAPDNALAHYQLGLTYVNLGRFKDAAQELETFAKLDPDHPKAGEAKSLAAELKKMGG